MDMLWLGYDGLSTPYAHISAVLIYRAELADRVIMAYGRVPANTLAVVVTDDGAYLPSSWSAQHLRAQLARWRAAL